MQRVSLWRHFQRWLSGGRTIGDLADWVGVPKVQIRATPLDYNVFYVPKRAGGQREIAAPNAELKGLQRRLLRRLLRGLTVHPAATGFERGRSIVDNALPHAGQAVVINLDVIAFFPSIAATRIEQFFRRCGWGRAASRLLCQLCTHEGSLPQGAPTSPRLSNLICYGLDMQLADLAEACGARYTRYADDITLSLSVDDDMMIKSLVSETRRILGRRDFTVHHRRKLSVRRSHQRQEVTGLVVNERPRLPREVRRWLRAVEHRVRMGRIATLTPDERAGWRAYQRMIERRVERSPVEEAETGAASS